MAKGGRDVNGMIEYLRGSLLCRDGAHVIVEAGSVGYGVDLPAPTLAVLPETGGDVRLFIYHHMTEQDVRLYGFASPEEREIFEVLIGASGIGPKTALGILSALDIADFAHAIMRSDITTLTRIPGIGKKTAERLIVDLRDKVVSFAAGQTSRRADAGLGAPMRLNDVQREAVSALISLDCKPVVAERAVLRAAEMLAPGARVEELIREALKHRH